ncbi:hypothetical protein ScPMuIL_018638 [Solemya velum]
MEWIAVNLFRLGLSGAFIFPKRSFGQKNPTYIGDVLVAVNPCQKLTIYDEEHHKRYSSILERKNQAPHIFWVADAAYRAMVRSDSKQCIVVSGDSGAGKTESTKYILKHLARQEHCSRLDLVQNIDQVNVLMELFGNASTILNKNSSRFGKLTELLYDNGGHLQGARIQCFILEKSRVVEHRPGERNFHIFYIMSAGMEATELQSLGLHKGSRYRFLFEGRTRTHYKNYDKQMDMCTKYIGRTNALTRLGLIQQEKSQIYRVLAAILHITGIEFDEDEESDGVIIVDEEPLTEACNQLALTDIKAMAEALVATTSFISGHEVKITHKSVARANDGRDAVAKRLYSCLFSGIVDRINQNYVTEVSWEKGLAGEALSIGILDISGFEDFAENRFEQLLINMANEKLHHYFQEYIFKLERQDLEGEGINSGTITFQDNSDVLELFFCRIVKLLEDETKVPGSNSKTLIKSLNKECDGHQRYRCENGCSFGIAHYARKVTYCAEGFLDKNTETLSRSLTDCLQKSGNTFVQSYVDRENEISGSHTPRLNYRHDQGAVLTVLTQRHRKNVNNTTLGKGRVSSSEKSLEQLTVKLNDANPLFVRYQTLVDQLLGRSETNVTTNVPAGFKSLTKDLLNVVDIQGYEMGFTKVFLKYHHMEMLDAKIESLVKREKEMEEQKRIAAENRLKEKEKANSEYTPVDGERDTNSKTMNMGIEDHNNWRNQMIKSSCTKTRMFVNIPIEDDENKTENNTNGCKAFDMFRLSEREVEESNKCEEMFLRIMRGVMYIILFLVVMVTAMISTTMLLSMSSNLFQVVVLESIQMFGVALLCFSVVPSMNLVQGVVISSTSGQIPSLLNFFGHIQVQRKNKFVMRVLCTLVAFIALIVQYGIHPVIHMTEIFSVTSPEESLFRGKWTLSRFSFSLALLLVAPVTILLLLLQCHYDVREYTWFTDELECSNMTLDKQMWVLVAGGCLWLSIILLTYGVWIPRCERMAKAERLFVTPIRESVSVGLNLLLRRRNDILYETINTTRRRKSDDRLPLRSDEKEIRPMLYVCATLCTRSRKWSSS